MTTAILLDVSEAKALLASGTQANQAFCFCPSAKYLMQQRGIATRSSAETYGALGHARTVVWIERTLPTLAQHYAAHYALSAGEAKILEVFVYHLLADMHYVHLATRHMRRTEEHYCWLESAQVKCGNYAQMLEGVAAAAAKRLYAYGRPHLSPAHYRLIRWCNHLIIRTLRKHRKIMLIDYGDRLSSRITRPMLALDDACTMIVPKPAKNMLHTLELTVKSWWRIARRNPKRAPVYLFRSAHPAEYARPLPTPSTPAALPALLANAVNNAVAAYMPFLRAEYAMGAAWIREANPHISVSDYSIYPYLYAGIEAAKSLDIPHIMANHGSHTVQHAPLATIAANRYARQERLVHPDSACFLPKSPLTAAIAEQMNANPNARIAAVDFFKHTRHVDDGGMFSILYAGNFSTMHNAYNSHIPLCKETAEEQLLAIHELIEECAQVPGVGLIIKLKNKKHDTYAELVQRFIDERGFGHFARVDTSPNFGALLARANLVVSNLSITIEEALINHIPVMIHTCRKQYFHIAEEYAGSAETLGPAYLVRQPQDIRAILAFVMENRGELHDPALYSLTSWQKNQLTEIPEFAKELLEKIKGSAS